MKATASMLRMGKGVSGGRGMINQKKLPDYMEAFGKRVGRTKHSDK